MRCVVLVCAVVLLAACGSGEATNDGKQQTQPDTHVLRVVLVDEVPLSVFFNWDDRQCTTGAFGRRPPVPTVIVRDADGTAVAVLRSPRLGGRKLPASCRMPLPPESVPLSDVYSVTATAGGEEYRVDVERGESPQTVVVRF
jgi:hypothetical protein